MSYTKITDPHPADHMNYTAQAWSCANPSAGASAHLDDFNELTDWMMSQERAGRCEALVGSYDSDGWRCTKRMAWTGERWATIAEDRHPGRTFRKPQTAPRLAELN